MKKGATMLKDGHTVGDSRGESAPQQNARAQSPIAMRRKLLTTYVSSETVSSLVKSPDENDSLVTTSETPSRRPSQAVPRLLAIRL